MALRPARKVAHFFSRFNTPRPPGFCCKPTYLWTNAPQLIAAWGEGRMFCSFPSAALCARGLPRCHPCAWHGRHAENGSVRAADETARTAGRAASFPMEFVQTYAQLMMQAVGVRRGEPETYARSDQTVAPTEEEHSVAAFCRLMRTAGRGPQAQPR